jgi:uncharacterized protein (DUF1697 family)
MNAMVALLRAVNVGGTGKLPMAELKSMCEACGLKQVKTYIASGNVVFLTNQPEAKVKARLEAKLKAYAGKPVDVLVRSAAELAAVLAENPFSNAPTNRTIAVFLDSAPPKDALKHATGIQSEEVRLGKREIYIHYVGGIADSKLRIPAAKEGTGRNMNTIAKLVVMLQGMGTH